MSIRCCFVSVVVHAFARHPWLGRALFVIVLALLGAGVAPGQEVGFVCAANADCPSACECSPLDECVGFDPLCAAPSCGDAICSSNETCGSCASDCGACPPPPPPPPPVEDRCDVDPDCPYDCWCEGGFCQFEGGFCSTIPHVCGDGECTSDEDVLGCPIDCRVCGDQICSSPWETNASCPADCTCQPTCPAGTCGDDGCGGTCACAGDDVCTSSSTCCVRNCSGFACGDDGCGGSCGNCASGSETCSGGFCLPVTSTVAVPVSCVYKVLDGYLRPLDGYTVKLEVWGEEIPTYGARTGLTGDTGPGVVSLSMVIDLPVDVLGNPVDHQVACYAVPQSGDTSLPPGLMRLTSPLDTSQTELYNLAWVARLAPKPDQVSPPFPGLQTTAPFHGQGSARLYLSADGVYDRAVVIVEPFNPSEIVAGKRAPGRMWLEYNGNPLHLDEDAAGNPLPPPDPADSAAVAALLVDDATWQRGILYRMWQQGFDIWLMQPHRTGQDIHEQAAELAQAVSYAAGNAHGLGTPQNDKVAVFGFSLGGLVTRIATARWSDPGEASWRAEAQLDFDAPPVAMVITGDSPLRGAQVNVELQKTLWDQNLAAEQNLNSCAAQQMLLRSCRRLHSLFEEADCDSTFHDRFYRQGTGFSFFNGGSTVTCQGGPAVFALGDQGWPIDVRRVGWSNGNLIELQRCYGDWRDLNGDLEDMCPGAGIRVLHTGDEFLHIELDPNHLPEGWAPDIHWRYRLDDDGMTRAWDVAPGSRHDAVLAESSSTSVAIPVTEFLVNKFSRGFLSIPLRLGITIRQQQRLPLGTFIPTRSALDIDSADPTSTPGFPLGDYRMNSFNASHRTLRADQVAWVLGKLDEAWAPVSPAPQPAAYLDLDGSESASIGGGQHAGLVGGSQKTWAFWLQGRGQSGAIAAIWQAPDPHRIWRIAADDMGRRLGVFLFDPATGEPAFLYSERFMSATSGWHFVVLQADGGGPTDADRFKIWVDGVQHTVANETPNPVAASLGTSGAAPFEVGRNGSAFEGLLGELVIVDGVLTGAERSAWQQHGIDFTHPGIVSGYRWRGDLMDAVGVNHLQGSGIVAGEVDDFATTTDYPSR